MEIGMLPLHDAESGSSVAERDRPVCCRSAWRGAVQPCGGRRRDRGHEEPRSMKSYVILATRTSNSRAGRRSAGSAWKRWSGSGLITRKCHAGRWGRRGISCPRRTSRNSSHSSERCLTNTYADKIESYSGEGVQYLNERNGKRICRGADKGSDGKDRNPARLSAAQQGLMIGVCMTWWWTASVS